ncbi:MAG: hypothetical protein HC842_04965 [Cytophagales bacterium]|nr:hypothetical protein [Cytophagales bacterium]
MRAGYKILWTLLWPCCVAAQQKGDILVAAEFDFYKTDNIGLLGKGQAGMELFYFRQAGWALTAGAEYWTREWKGTVGLRAELNERWYLRARGVIGERSYFNAGLGHKVPLGKRWVLENLLDYYPQPNDLALRTGVLFRF